MCCHYFKHTDTHTHTDKRTHRAHILNRAAAPLARGDLAAGGVFGTLIEIVALLGAELNLNAGGGWQLGVPWNHHFSFDARCLVLVALIVVGTAVAPISAAHCLGGGSERGSATFTSCIPFSSSPFFGSQLSQWLPYDRAFSDPYL